MGERVIEPMQETGPNRYCEPCGHDHGPLYVCDSYTPELKAEVTAACDRFRANLVDPVWVEKQIAAGTPREVISIYRMFAGIEDP